MFAQQKHLMRILILSSWYPIDNNSFNGVFVKEQAHTLSKYHDVEVISFEINYSSKIRFFKLQKKNLNNGMLFKETLYLVDKSLPIYNQLNFFFTVFRQIKIDYKCKKYDIIHAHVSYPAGLIAYLTSRYFKIPYVITEHASPFEMLFRSWIQKKIALYSLRKASKIISVSKNTHDIILKYLSNVNIEVVPNVLIDSKFVEIYNKKNEKVRIGFLGGLNTNQKGLDILLYAISFIDNKYNFIVEIGGDGILKDEYENLANQLGIQEKCMFQGGIHPDNVKLFMQGIDFFVLPSRHESFGIVLIEAMAAGKPIIASRCGGPEEIVNPEVGILFSNENVSELTKSIEYMLENYLTYNHTDIQENARSKYGEIVFESKLNIIYSDLIKI